MGTCSLCRGSQMVKRSDGLMIKCPACFDQPSPKFNRLYKYFERAFIKTMSTEKTNKDKIITPINEELEEQEKRANNKILACIGKDKIKQIKNAQGEVVYFPDQKAIEQEQIDRINEETRRKLKEDLKTHSARNAEAVKALGEIVREQRKKKD